jgi:hypothetical protein
MNSKINGVGGSNTILDEIENSQFNDALLDE